MSLETLSEMLRARLPELAPLDARVKFVVEGQGVILLDATETAPALAHEDGEAACTVRLAEDKLAQLLAGTLSPTLAYSLGQIKVEGSLGLAMKLASLLEG
jgi:putative sterol carrier protein